MSDVEQIRDCASSLYALALKARDNNLDDYAAQLEELAAEASAHAERLNSEVQSGRASNSSSRNRISLSKLYRLTPQYRTKSSTEQVKTGVKHN